MSGALTHELARVVRTRDDVVAAHEHRSHGNVTVLEGHECLLERDPHVAFVAIHAPYRRRDHRKEAR